MWKTTKQDQHSEVRYLVAARTLAHPRGQEAAQS
eukprot:CAMPEP_0172602100 /NCGR_PEP_ID=MMETSP1068-20121228/22312_1 /TAXON_ID=35684 /ORGANISM="Pseudopedinella elastica, Strain CCMP716" /LENGTH=33 /DNA_ID= /DNA_START= /DNA_END= /DNA_ORIENTATION=